MVAISVIIVHMNTANNVSIVGNVVSYYCGCYCYGGGVWTGVGVKGKLIMESCCRKSYYTRQLYQKLRAFHEQSQELPKSR